MKYMGINTINISSSEDTDDGCHLYKGSKLVSMGEIEFEHRWVLLKVLCYTVFQNCLDLLAVLEAFEQSSHHPSPLLTPASTPGSSFSFFSLEPPPPQKKGRVWRRTQKHL